MSIFLNNVGFLEIRRTEMLIVAVPNLYCCGLRSSLSSLMRFPTHTELVVMRGPGCCRTADLKVEPRLQPCEQVVFYTQGTVSLTPVVQKAGVCWHSLLLFLSFPTTFPGLLVPF